MAYCNKGARWLGCIIHTEDHLHRCVQMTARPENPGRHLGQHFDQRTAPRGQNAKWNGPDYEDVSVNLGGGKSGGRRQQSRE